MGEEATSAERQDRSTPEGRYCGCRRFRVLYSRSAWGADHPRAPVSALWEVDDDVAEGGRLLNAVPSSRMRVAKEALYRNGHAP